MLISIKRWLLLAFVCFGFSCEQHQDGLERKYEHTEAIQISGGVEHFSSIDWNN